MREQTLKLVLHTQSQMHKKYLCSNNGQPINHNRMELKKFKNLILKPLYHELNDEDLLVKYMYPLPATFNWLHWSLWTLSNYIFNQIHYLHILFTTYFLI